MNISFEDRLSLITIGILLLATSPILGFMVLPNYELTVIESLVIIIIQLSIGSIMILVGIYTKTDEGKVPQQKNHEVKE